MFSRRSPGLRPSLAVTEPDAISAWRNGAQVTLPAMPRVLHAIEVTDRSGASCWRFMKSSVTCKSFVHLTRRAACAGPAAEDCLKRGDYGRINDFCVAADIVTNNCQASWAVSAALGPPSLPDRALRSRRLMIAIAL